MSPKKLLAFLVYLLVLLIPWWVFLQNTGTDPDVLFTPQSGMRFFGLYALSLIWVQIILGSFMKEWIAIFGPKTLRFHIAEGIFALLLVFTHRAMSLVYEFSLNPMATVGELLIDLRIPGYEEPLAQPAVFLGTTALYLLILTAVTAYFRHKDFLVRYWRRIHYLNYLIFFLALTHSLTLGSDTRHPALLLLYAIMALVALFAFIRAHLLPKKYGQS